MGDQTSEMDARWCILQVAASRTLALAASLAGAGLTVWTPKRIERRSGRGKQRDKVIETELAIVPGFVFADGGHLSDLLRIRAAPVNEHPGFSLLRSQHRVPLVSERSLAPLRAAEERFRRTHLKNVRRKMEIGTAVRMASGGFAGMRGVVVAGPNGREAIDLGGIFGQVEIASYLVDTVVLCEVA